MTFVSRLSFMVFLSIMFLIVIIFLFLFGMVELNQPDRYTNTTCNITGYYTLPVCATSECCDESSNDTCVYGYILVSFNISSIIYENKKIYTRSYGPSISMLKYLHRKYPIGKLIPCWYMISDPNMVYFNDFNITVTAIFTLSSSLVLFITLISILIYWITYEIREYREKNKLADISLN